MKTLNLQTTPFLIPQKLNKLLQLCFFMSLIFMSITSSAQNFISADAEPVTPTLTPMDCIDMDLIDPDAICPEIYEPVCGCNNITYENECVAKSNGVTSYTKGVCPCDVSLKVISRETTCDGYNICVEIIGGVAPYELVVSANTIITNPEEAIYCFSGLEGGSYTVKVEDAKECLATLDINLPIIDYFIEAKVKDLSCFESQDGSIVLNIPVDVVLKYKWEGPNGFTASTQNIDGLAAGTYKVKVTYEDGSCYGVAYYEVKQPRPLQLEIKLDYKDCEGQPDGCAYITGGTHPYQLYVFRGEAIDNDFAPEITVTPNGPSVADVELTNDVNFEEPTSDEDKACASNIPNGIYLVIAIDANGCYDWEIIKVDAAPVLSLEIEKKDASCYGNTDGVACYKVSGGTAPYQVVIVPNTPIIPYTDEAGCFEGLGAGVYEITVVDAKNCSYTARVEIKQADELMIEFKETSDACADQVDGCLKVSGGTPGYKIWIFTCPDDSPVITDVEPVIDANGNPTVEGMEETDELIFYPNTAEGFVVCAEDIPANIYYVLVIDEAGCWKFKKIEILEKTGLKIKSEIKHVSCFGGHDGAIDIKVIGGTAPYSYEWSNGATTEDIDGLVAGEYKVLVKDAKGCLGRATFTVRQPNKLEIDFKITSEACADQVDGCLKISGGTPDYKVWVYTCPSVLPVLPDPVFTNADVVPVVDGMDYNADVAFLLNNTTDADYIRCAKNIPAGVYYVLVVDSNGCWEWAKIEIPNPSGIRIKGEITHVSCGNQNNGAIDIEVAGGNPPYFYSWSNGATTQDISGLAPGEYTVKVYTEDDFCTATATFVVKENGNIILNCKFDPYGEYACVSPEGGTEPYKVQWFDLVTGLEIPHDEDNCIYDLEPGSYYVKVTDANGCMATEIFIVEPKVCAGGEAIVDPKEINSGESTVFTLVNWYGQSIQWQFMTEYTDWVNVPEGTTEVFVTPPIHVGTSKWIKVRAVVTCWDGTIVYSTVARLHVIGSDGTGLVEVESESANVVDRKMFDVKKLPAGLTTQDISVYPTISTGRVTVRFDEVTGDLTRVKIMDLSGQVKESIDAGTPNVGSTKEINLSNYAPGMYLITVETAGKRTTKRVVIGK